MATMLNRVVQLFCRHRYNKIKNIFPSGRYYDEDGKGWNNYYALWETRCIKCGKAVRGRKCELKKLVKETNR